MPVSGPRTPRCAWLRSEPELLLRSSSVRIRAPVEHERKETVTVETTRDSAVAQGDGLAHRAGSPARQGADPQAQRAAARQKRAQLANG